MASIHDYEPIWGEWKIDKRLGGGGFGEVYSAHKESLGITQWAAVKRIELPSHDKDKGFLERIQKEIDAMIQMKDYPHIVKIEDFAVVDWKRDRGQDILIRMELLAGIEGKRLSADDVIKLGIHICRMLEVCERQNIIHRDIKPANIFITKYGDYKLGDFGIARTLDEGRASTRTGTMDFMAPEVYSLRRKYDSRADICSLGLTMYYLLNGNKLPFEGEDNDESPIVRRLDGELLPKLLRIPESLSSVVMKACAFEADDRYSNAREMREALESGYNEKTVFTPVDIELGEKGITDAKLTAMVTNGTIPKNVSCLDLQNNDISRLTPLKGLTNLTKLFLNQNQISDLAPLKELIGLTELFLADNQISDITPLKGLANMMRLELHNNKISDISPLKGLTKITSLGLVSTEVSDLTPLKGLINLTELGLYNDKISVLSPLKGLTKLTTLTLNAGKISDLTPLYELTNLKTLILFNVETDHLSSLKRLTNLSKLQLYNKQISDAQRNALRAALPNCVLDCLYGAIV